MLSETQRTLQDLPLRNREEQREEMLVVCQTEHQNKVNTSGFTLAEQENEEETVVIVKPKGDKGLELVSSSKTMKVALDNSPNEEGIAKVTPNHVKNLFVVSVSKTANLVRLCNINKLEGIPNICYLPFNNRAESCVILNAQQSIREGNSNMYYMRWACHAKGLLGYITHVDGERKPTRSV